MATSIGSAGTTPLYSPSPATGPRHFDVPWDADDEMVECPVPLSWSAKPGELRAHFQFRHYDQTLCFNGDTRTKSANFA
jgi:hypothetical protein